MDALAIDSVLCMFHVTFAFCVCLRAMFCAISEEKRGDLGAVRSRPEPGEASATVLRLGLLVHAQSMQECFASVVANGAPESFCKCEKLLTDDVDVHVPGAVRRPARACIPHE